MDINNSSVIDNGNRKAKRLVGKCILIVIWVAMALVLAVAATLICSVKLLRPEALTAITMRAANKMLDASVYLGRVEFKFEPSFPVLSLEIDSISILSHYRRTAPDSISAQLPLYGDTLFCASNLAGRIDLGAILGKGEIALRDVSITRPEINIVIAGNDINNFNIYHSESEDTESANITPPFSINRFEILNPKPIRYYNNTDGTKATITLSEVSLNGSEAPAYAISVQGNLESPMAKQLINLDGVTFGAKGKVYWNPVKASTISLDKFELAGAFIKAELSTELDFGQNLAIESAKATFQPIAVKDLLTIVPDSLVRAYGLTDNNFQTNATLTACIELIHPFYPDRDSIPYANISFNLPDCEFKYGKAYIKQLGLDIDAHLKGNNIDSATFDIKRFEIAGPATHLIANAKLTQLLSDPAFDASLRGNVKVDNLPAIVSKITKGYLGGTLTASMDAKGKASMFQLGRFHELDVKGHLKASNFRYNAADSNLKANISFAEFKFGSQVANKHTNETSPNTSFLASGIKVDSAHVSFDGINMAVSGLSLGFGAENMSLPGDTTVVIPMGGGLKINRFNLDMISDSAGVRVRNLAGHVSLRRFQNDRHLPLISANLDAERISAGAPTARFMLTKAHIDANTHLRPDRVKPDTTRRRRKTRLQRKEDGSERIDWGASKGIKRYLNNWKIDGNLSAKRASLFTPFFPLRNRMQNLDIVFNNDSVVFNKLLYKAGHSDLSMKGLVSNIRRSLSSRTGRQALNVDFTIMSDTIDVNQLAAAVFSGAAYAERLSRGDAQKLGTITNEEEEFADFSSQDTTAMAPIVIPTNINASMSIEAHTILYSDLSFNEFAGDVLVYDGAVNLSYLAAKSQAGSVALSALYTAPKATDMRFGMGLQLEDIKVERFLKLVPAIDSIMPLMRDFAGTINANIAATVAIDSCMNFKLPTLDAAIHLSGDSLKIIDADTYRTLGKWLRFKDRADNTIKHMGVDLMVKDNKMEMFPFTFDIDRYRLGVFGSNDLNLNFNYHIAVLKSPLPFRFGINVKGNPDDYKVRFGGSKYKEGMAAESIGLVDTMRVNLISQIQNVFKRGVSSSGFAKLEHTHKGAGYIDLETETLSREDSLALMREGLIPNVSTDTIKLIGNDSIRSFINGSTGKIPHQERK